MTLDEKIEENNNVYNELFQLRKSNIDYQDEDKIKK